MGNQLVGIAPSQIYPVEHYLSDHAELTFDQSLGSTRFFKVARARCREGLAVVKVFAVHDPSLPLAEHKERILKIKEQLASAFNCLPFQRVILTDKAGLLLREYCKYSVYDRMSTRPYLTTLEKKWITFQVLYALHRMHKLGICHGDIKLENIMVTSWLWVLLTDIASFKPTFLPDDNPADYSYFFDTSRRRVCYVAPERFVSAPDPNSIVNEDKMAGLLLSESPCKLGELVPSMDIFSAGCALFELWKDGTPALDLPGLLAYRNGSPRPSSMTLPNADPMLQQLLISMTERDPHARKSAEIYLDEARGKLFPEYFYSFLQSYMLIFSGQPILPPDEKIIRIHQDIRNIIKIFTQPSENKNYQDLVENPEKNTVDNIDTLMRDGFKILNLKMEEQEEEEKVRREKKELGPDAEGLILITSLVTSCIRGLHHSTSKLHCLEILQLLCENSSAETILDRILPYIIHLTHDASPLVRAQSLTVVTKCLALVQSVPSTDCNVFPEYIFPELTPAAADPHQRVRRALASNIAELAETALRFLDETQNMAGSETANINYETELATLHEMVRAIVSSLLTDPQASVKRALVDNGITKLCVFFGKQKANDVILSHMVTFLNDKESVSLRGCFFERATAACAYVGQHTQHIILPLLQQGLTDQSEWIIAAALRASASLASLGLLQKQALCSLLAESVPYLAHPNLWIRQEVCGLVSCVAALLNPIDVHCKVLPLVWPHLQHKLIQVDLPELLLESLADPIPRPVLDAVLKHGDVDRLVHTLRERRNARLKVKQGMMPQYSEMGQQLKNLFRRLASDGMTEQVENQLLAMSAHLIKIQRSTTQHITEAPGRLSLKNSSISKSVQLDSRPPEGNIVQGADKMYASGQRSNKTSVTTESHMNTEWQHMFGHSHEQHSIRAPHLPAASQAALSTSGSLAGSAPNATHSATYVHYSMAPCRIELRNLIARMQQKFVSSLRSQDSCVEGVEHLPPSNWQPGNTLLAYLHEHRSRVNQLVTLPANPQVFASCSDDGTVRLWDASKLDGHCYINKSAGVYNRGAGGVSALAACERGHSLVAGTHTGTVFILRPELSSSRVTMTQSVCMNAGGVCGVAGTHAAHVCYVTKDRLVGWDPRSPGLAFNLQGDLKRGVYTCLYVSPGGNYCACGTAAGALAVWDLRFQLPVATLTHDGERIRQISGFGTSTSCIWTAGGRDASAFCLETSHRSYALTSQTHSNPSTNYTSCVRCVSVGGRRAVAVGGSDQRLRLWDLDRPDASRVLVHSSHTLDNLTYRSRIIDGTTVIQEIYKPQATTPILEENIYRNIENRSYYHIAPITDITLTMGNSCYLVSASADGVINVWK